MVNGRLFFVDTKRNCGHKIDEKRKNCGHKMKMWTQNGREKFVDTKLKRAAKLWTQNENVDTKVEDLWTQNGIVDTKKWAKTAKNRHFWAKSF